MRKKFYGILNFNRRKLFQLLFQAENTGPRVYYNQFKFLKITINRFLNYKNKIRILGKDHLLSIKELVKQITNKFINMNYPKIYYSILKSLIRILMIKLMKNIDIDANFNDKI